MQLNLPSTPPRLLSLAAWVGLAAMLSLGSRAVLAAGAADGAAEDSEHAHHHHHLHEARQALSRATAAYAIPDVMLVDQSGQKVSLRALLDGGEPVLVNFIFTSCTAICPVMSGTFAQVQKDLGADAGKVRMVSISIDPEHDTPAELSRYAGRFAAGPQWTFLTGASDDVVAVQRAFDAYRGDKMNHTPLTLMRASPQGEWIRYDGLASATDLVREAREMMGS